MKRFFCLIAVCVIVLALSLPVAATEETPQYIFHNEEEALENLLEEALNAALDFDSTTGVLTPVEVENVVNQALMNLRDDEISIENTMAANKVALFAETVGARAAVEDVEGNTVVVDRDHLTYEMADGMTLEKLAVQTAILTEGALELDGADLGRPVRNCVVFNVISEETETATIIISRDVLSTGVETIQVWTEHCGLEIDLQSMAENFSEAADGQLVFSLRAVPDESGQTEVELQCPEALHSPVRLCFPAGRDGADELVGIRVDIRVDADEDGADGVQDMVTGFYNATSQTMNCLAVKSGKYHIEKNKPVFSDIENLPKEKKRSIEMLASRNIVRGYSDGTFRPYNDVTRAQFVAFTMRTLGKDVNLNKVKKTVFTDVAPSAWYYHEVMNAYSMGLIKGLKEDFFGGDQTINAVQIYIVTGRVLRNEWLYKIPADCDAVLKKAYSGGGYQYYGEETRKWLAVSTCYQLVLEQPNRVFNGGSTMDRGNVAVVTKRVYNAGH